MSLAPTAASSRCVYDAPMALDATLSHTRGMEPEAAKARNHRQVQDLMKAIVGPIPVEAFLDGFLPRRKSWSKAPSHPRKHAFKVVPPNAATAEGICGPLMDALNKATKRCPGYLFHNTSQRSLHPRRLAHMKPHICCYAAENLDVVQRAGVQDRSEFGYAEFFIDVKPSPSHDYFADPSTPPITEERTSHDFIAPAEDLEVRKHRDRALGQHIAYVTEIFARQHRVSVFSVSLAGSRARLLRWDRAGCVVTESFDLRERADLFYNFLWHFSQSTHRRRGHDVTIEVASSEEEELFRESIKAHVIAQLALEEGSSLDDALRQHYKPGHVAVVHVLAHGYPATAAHVHRFIVSRPVVSPLHLTGRSTTGYWAVDPRTGNVVFLKDTWRAYPPVDLEGETLGRMHDQGVRNIPDIVCHGDVPDYIPQDDHEVDPRDVQVSETDEYQDDACVCKVMGDSVVVAKHWHYRVVLGTVGYGLRDLRGTGELLHATYDVFHAMTDALRLDSRLHRDISVGNIILVRDRGADVRRGVLVDWETSCRVDDTGRAVEPGRVGTWFFMSIEMLRNAKNNRAHTFQDDMESLLYVVFYCSLLWLPHALPEKQLAITMNLLFEYSDSISAGRIGGHGKIVNARRRVHIDMAAFRPPMQDWLQTVMEFHHPVAHTSEEYADRWTNPEYLDRFWGDFLKTHVLDRDDRVVHGHLQATGVYKAVSVAASTEAILLGGRSSDERTSAPPRKRTRRTTATIDAPPVEPRRSNRIREKQERVQAAPSSSKQSALSKARPRARRPKTSSRKK
ncbi:hypothetical protein OH76DRAFT_92714 [Lentinus brumalis]|uniref:Fungal-type protein kinase domain-containing protein n=1 Tax=Lentinus brumalis TaxID=2498619 RepID=A0A371CQT6_9APHY|nr:hypothetical protein OH76DRAFT_92714 [Polyporus brumalis]